MRIGQLILEWLFPTKCAFCHRLTKGREQRVCPICKKNIPYTRGAAAEQKLSYIEKCLSPLYYEGNVRESLLRYKFGGACGYCDIYADLIVKTIDERGVSCDIITWVPLSRKRLRRRGYDQARLIAERASELMGIEAVPLLKKTRNIKAQSSTGDAQARRKNVAGVYAPVDAEHIKNKRILIFDDIVTTGATLSECASVLRKYGAKSVTAATVARKRA